MDSKSIRFFDIILSLILILSLSPVWFLVLAGCWVKFGAPIFIQTRMGRYGNLFKIYKFRTMERNTPSMPTHLVDPSNVSTFGKILRRSKLDELPQLINVLKGDMCLVGPRPNLEDQFDVIAARKKLNIYEAKPGITGRSQLGKIDMSQCDRLAKSDRKMLDNISLAYYFKILIKTATGNGVGDVLRNG